MKAGRVLCYRVVRRCDFLGGLHHAAHATHAAHGVSAAVAAAGAGLLLRQVCDEAFGGKHEPNSRYQVSHM